MPILNVYVDDRTLAILTEYGQRHGREVEELASAAVEDAAIRTLPPPPATRQRVCADGGTEI